MEEALKKTAYPNTGQRVWHPTMQTARRGGRRRHGRAPGGRQPHTESDSIATSSSQPSKQHRHEGCHSPVRKQESTLRTVVPRRQPGTGRGYSVQKCSQRLMNKRCEEWRWTPTALEGQGESISAKRPRAFVGDDSIESTASVRPARTLAGGGRRRTSMAALEGGKDAEVGNSDEKEEGKEYDQVDCAEEMMVVGGKGWPGSNGRTVAVYMHIRQ
ncbi:hypothetical protein NM688_g1928 [Phlebia brevispora]|uniref:Uncharacterized protein n=1 Tax=Phlebia brevispora TaxID=194682 RepID=A0ACC1TAF3_9APHY|nr:hypothetical protein NM688_g1928 [Phlebia brevispora]